MFKQMQLVDSYSRSGKYIGKFTLYHVSDRDIERINRVVEKIIKGLFYNKFNKIVPEDWIIKIQWITPEVEKDMSLIQLADTLKWEVIKKDTFAYGFNFVPETYQSVWILDFFKVPLFYVFVIDRETAREK